MAANVPAASPMTIRRSQSHKGVPGGATMGFLGSTDLPDGFVPAVTTPTHDGKLDDQRPTRRVSREARPTGKRRAAGPQLERVTLPAFLHAGEKLEREVLFPRKAARQMLPAGGNRQRTGLTQ